MEELSVEQKAKAYDKAIEKANSLLSGNQLGNAWIYKLFPELKESDDERVWKELFKHLKEGADGYEPAGNSEDYKRWLGWFEKQGQTFTKKDVDDAYLEGICVAKHELEKQVPINEEAEKEKNDYVSGQFLYCKGSFNEFKEGEFYWIEYISNDTYIGRSDNILNQKFHITPRQLYTWLDPRHPEKQGEQKSEEEVDNLHNYLYGEQKPVNNKFTSEQASVLDKHIDKFLEHNSAWSEERERMLDEMYEFFDKHKFPSLKHGMDDYAKLIKFLKDRWAWKPTEAQLASLTIACDRNDRIGFDLTQLLKDLKKLK